MSASDPNTTLNLESGLTRREAMLQMLKVGGAGAGVAALGVWLTERSEKPVPPALGKPMRNHTVAADARWPVMVVVKGGEPAALVQRAIADLGGMSRFVSRGETVLLKPNIAWDRTPEQAANTNPEVVAETVRQCWHAGAKNVIVTDVSCNESRRCFQRSGIAEAAKREGAEVILPEPSRFREVNIGGDVLQNWLVFEPFLNADKIINLPIAKHHGLTGATLGMKNWYGILGGQRNRLHQQIHQSLADLAAYMRPTLTIMDAYRVLLRNGPTGGNLEDVSLEKTMIASTDPVALDAYVAKAYWDLDSDRLPYLKIASDKGLGTVEFEKVHTVISTI
jgi:uncharacterized protein (DUF362 family)